MLLLQGHSNSKNHSEYESASKSAGCEHSVKNATFPTPCYPLVYAPFPNGYYSEFCWLKFCISFSFPLRVLQVLST